MSLALLLEKYDVSTEEGLQKALNEIEKEQSEVDEALSGVLSRAYTLEGRLRTASQAYSKLGEVKNDAQAAADMIDKTAGLARDVSAKVRQLDLARSRVAECQRRVHDLIDLQLCSAGVEAAIKAHDYETGATHVARFLSMEPGSVAAARARGAPDAPDPRAAMARAANTLREHLLRKFEEAARKEDEAAVERLFKLFPQIGRAGEGVQLLATFLAKQAESGVRAACAVGPVTAETCVFADAFTRLLQTAAATIDKARRAAPAHLPAAIRVIQPTICAGARRLLSELVSARRLDAAEPWRCTADALAAEPLAAELAHIHNTIRMYLHFLRRSAQADSASLDEEKKKEVLAEVEKTLAECDLTRTAQDVLSHYLALERYFLEESVNKALKLGAPQPGATTSTLVDDVFFIARKVIRRAASTGSVDGLCCVLNEVSSVLERCVASALRRWLRSPPLDALPLPAPPPHAHALPAHTAVADAAGLLAQRLNRDLDAQRMLYLAHTNEAEAGAEWSERLAGEAVAEAEARCVGGGEKVASCAAGLAGAAAAFRAARDLALAGLAAAAHPRAAAWADRLADPAHSTDEMEDDADLLPCALETTAECARAALPARAADVVLAALVAEIAARAETRIMHNTYTVEGGLLVERRARRLAAWAGGNAGGARERCARLSHAAALLSAERLAHAQAHAHHTLSPKDAAAILSRRVDFNPEEIKRLKL